MKKHLIVDMDMERNLTKVKRIWHDGIVDCYKKILKSLENGVMHGDVADSVMDEGRVSFCLVQVCTQRT